MKQNPNSPDFFVKKLKYKLSKNKKSYFVTGTKMGCGKVIKVPASYKGKPVVGIGKRAFYDKRITSVELPNSVKYISDKAFGHCKKLNHIVMSQSLVAIGKKAFSGCKSLESIYLPLSAVIIRKKAFEGCKKLTIKCERTTPMNFLKRKWNCRRPVSYGEGAVSSSKATTPASNFLQKPVEKAPVSGTFVGKPLAAKPQNVAVAEASLTFEKPSGANAYIVTGIGSYNKPDVVIPSTYEGLPVSAIKQRAFEGCMSIESVTIPSSVLIIGPDAFSGCKSLTSVTVMSSGQKQLICENSFKGCSSLVSVRLSASVSEVPSNAFLACSSLERIDVDERNELYCSVDGVLYTKDMKTLVCFPSAAATTFIVPSKVVYIGAYAFACSTAIERVTVPSSVTKIEDGAFGACKQLKYVQLPSSLTKIGATAFQGCISLGQITLPKGLTFIGENAFFHCKALEIRCDLAEQPSGWDANWNPDSRPVEWAKPVDISIPVEDDETCSKGLEFTLHQETDSYIISGIGTCNDIHVVIPEHHQGKKVTVIGAKSFADCKKIQSVEVPASVMIIAPGAFSGCESLDSVKLSDGVRAIGDGAFAYCTSLARILFPASVVEISSNAFLGCTALTRYEVNARNTKYLDDEGVLYSKDYTTIISYPVSSWSSSFSIPSLVSKVAPWAFYQATSLEEVVIHDGVTFVGEQAFGGCPDLVLVCDFEKRPSEWDPNWNPDKRPVTWTKADPNNPVVEEEEIVVTNTEEPVPVVEEEAPAPVDTSVSDECDLELELSENERYYTVVGIGNCIDDEISIPETYNGKPVFAIAESAFANNESIKSVVMPSSIIAIGNSAFEYCSSLESISLSERLALIGSSAFNGCESLKSIFIPNDVADIGALAFFGCTSLLEIGVGTQNQSFASANGILYSKDMKTLICYPAGKTDRRFYIPNGTELIFVGSFAFNSNIEHVILPSTITTIGNSAFAFCNNLYDIAIPKSVTLIQNRAFLNCDSILINCEHTEKPEGWEENWNESNCPVTWKPVPKPIDDIDIDVFNNEDFDTLIDEILNENSEPTQNDTTSVSEDNSLVVDEEISVVDEEISVVEDATEDAIPKKITSTVEEDGVPRRVTATVEDTIPVVDEVEDEVGGELEFSLNKNGTAYSVKSIGTFKGADVVIPTEYDDTPVTSVGKWSFKNSSIKSVEIPSSVTFIGDKAFIDCHQLEAVTFDSGIKFINTGSFCDCIALKKLFFPDSLKQISFWAFKGCTSLTDVSIPDTATVDENAFAECPNVNITYRHVINAASVDVGIQTLKPTSIDDDIDTDDEDFFGGYDELEPSTTDTDDDTSITVDIDNDDVVVNEPKTEDEITVDVDDTSIILDIDTDDVIVNEPKIEDEITVDVDDTTVTSDIDAEDVSVDESFKLLDATFEVKGAEYVINLDENDEPIVPVDTTEDEDDDDDDVDLTGVDFNKLLKDMQELLGQIDEAVADIKTSVGMINESENSVEASVGLEFALNKNGDSYTLKGFGECTDSDIVIPAVYEGLPVTSVGKWAFRDSNVTNVVIPSTVVYIGDKAFMGCHSLESVAIGEGVRCINAGAFYGCEKLNTINFPASLKQISFWAFKDCTALTDVEICNSTVVDPAAFDGCTSINISKVDTPYSITIAPSISKASPVVTEEPVVEEPVVEEPVIQDVVEDVVEEVVEEPTVEDTVENNAVYSEGLELTLNKNGDSYSVKGIGSCTDSVVIIPSKVDGLPVTSVGKWAFKGSSISEVIVPSTVSFIGDKAFMDCHSLEAVTLNEGVKYINAGSFCNCDRLTSVTLPESLKQIGFWAFKGCASLSSVSIPSGANVDPSAFEGCSL